ncbi:MAG: 50S ribosomal protein L11 [Candidatus Diapherotrites archaeon]|nr:50S ribosomal protein L11 [Candidatus Diapherotrites archaeon]
MTDVKFLIEGGKGGGGALGMQLGPLGLPLNDITKEINEKTKDFTGMKVPVTVHVEDKTKKWSVEVGTPPVSALILKEIGAKKGTGKVKEQPTGDLKMEQIVKIAKMKKDSVNSTNLKATVLQIAGSCVSVGCTIDGKRPQDVQKEIKDGKHDALFE